MEWVTSLEITIEGTLFINGRLTLNKLYRTQKTCREHLFIWQDLFGNRFSRAVFLKDCGHDLVVVLARNTTTCVSVKFLNVID